MKIFTDHENILYCWAENKGYIWVTQKFDHKYRREDALGICMHITTCWFDVSVYVRGGDLKGKRALIWERKIIIFCSCSIVIPEVILIIDEARNFQIVEDNEKLMALINSLIFQISIQIKNSLHKAVTYINMVNK